eukprot:scaffold7349_cov173-Amphora_coffeaeformis.AAC.35
MKARFMRGILSIRSIRDRRLFAQNVAVSSLSSSPSRKKQRADATENDLMRDQIDHLFDTEALKDRQRLSWALRTEARCRRDCEVFVFLDNTPDCAETLDKNEYIDDILHGESSLRRQSTTHIFAVAP